MSRRVIYVFPGDQPAELQSKFTAYIDLKLAEVLTNDRKHHHPSFRLFFFFVFLFGTGTQIYKL